MVKRRNRIPSVAASGSPCGPHHVEPGSVNAVEMTGRLDSGSVTNPNPLTTGNTNMAINLNSKSVHSIPSANSQEDLDIPPMAFTINKLDTEDSLYLEDGQEGAVR